MAQRVGVAVGLGEDVEEDDGVRLGFAVYVKVAVGLGVDVGEGDGVRLGFAVYVGDGIDSGDRRRVSGVALAAGAGLAVLHAVKVRTRRISIQKR